jgi:cbb3-type cytochrome oxidase subunit 3
MVPLIALAVVIVLVVVYLISQANRKTRDQGNR